MVVDIGKPTVLKASKIMILVRETAIYRIRISCSLKPEGLTTSLLTRSIISTEKNTPVIKPAAAIAKITFLEETLEPMAGFKKLTASLDMPVTK